MLKKLLFALPLVILTLVGGIYFFANQTAKSQADLIIEQALSTGAYQAISYESVDVNLFSAELTLHSLSITDLQQTTYIIDKIVINDFDLAHEVPHHVTIKASGLSLPAGLPGIANTNNTVINTYLSSLFNGDSVPLELNYQYHYEPENNYLINSVIGINLEQVANIGFDAKLQNIPLEVLMESSSTPLTSLQQNQRSTVMLSAELPSVSFTIQDLGIVENLIALEAEKNRITTDIFRQRLIASTQSMYRLAPADTQEIAMEISSTLARFLEGSKVLKVAIEPEFNGSVQRLQPQIITAIFSGNYKAVFELLHLEVSAE